MLNILVYSGGIYRFDEMVEFIEDTGGILLKKDEFHISRGAYFISQEIHVTIVIPEEAFEDLKTIAEELKGRLEHLEAEDEQKLAIISLIPVYNLLSRVGTWVNIETLEEMIECPCLNGVCQEYEDVSCSDELEKTLDDMCKMEIVENRISPGCKVYRLKND